MTPEPQRWQIDHGHTGSALMPWRLIDLTDGATLCTSAHRSDCERAALRWQARGPVRPPFRLDPVWQREALRFGSSVAGWHPHPPTA